MLDIETIQTGDPEVFAEIAAATNRKMSHNDMWVCAAAVRTRSDLVTQDEAMAEQFNRYRDSLDLIGAVLLNILVVYVPRAVDALAGLQVDDLVTTARMTDEFKHKLSQLPAEQAHVLVLRIGLDRGKPRTIQELAAELNLPEQRTSRIVELAMESLRGLEPGSGPGA